MALLLHSAGLGTFMPDLRPCPSWSQDFPGNVKFFLQKNGQIQVSKVPIRDLLNHQVPKSVTAKAFLLVQDPGCKLTTYPGSPGQAMTPLEGGS